jgi:hypothetical protein
MYRFMTLAKAMADDPLIKADRQRLAQILSGSPQAACSP